MSSMGNSQDDAQYQTSEDKKLNRQQPQNSPKNNITKNNANKNNAKASQQSDKVSSIKSISEKLNEPLLGAKPSPNAVGVSHSDEKTTVQDDHRKKALDQTASNYLNAQRLGSAHPNFDVNKSVDILDPDRPLTDIPEPTPRYQEAINVLLTLEFEGGQEVSVALKTAEPEPSIAANKQASFEQASMWALIASPELASHLELLQLGGLINLPAQFFEPIESKPSEAIQQTPHSSESESVGGEAQDVVESRSGKTSSELKQPLQLLSPSTEMTLLDMSDIYQACVAYPKLTRYGFIESEQEAAALSSKASKAMSTNDVSSAMPEMINDLFAPNWELILYPERFDNGVDSLITDVLACSVAVHILKQCATRKTPNRNITAQQICQHMRSYVLSQCNINPHFEKQYRQIRLFVGHVIVAAHYLGMTVTQAAEHNEASTVNDKGQPSVNLGQPIYLNISSRAALLMRYPNISSYYINGWS